MSDRSTQDLSVHDASIDQLFDLSAAYIASRCLHVVAELGVADYIGDEPESPEKLSSKVGVDPGALNRILRLLAQCGVFEESHGRYGHSPLSRLLRVDHPRSQRAWVR